MSPTVTVRQQRITRLIEAVQEENVERVKHHVESGDPLEARDSWGQTALIWAAKSDAPEIVGLLLEAGADVDARDEDGDSALMSAVRLGNTEIVEALMHYGAKLKLKNHAGETPLGYAAKSRPEVVSLLERLKKESKSSASWLQRLFGG